MNKKVFLLVLAILPLFLFSSCEKDNGETGKLKLNLTDAPIDSEGITGVHITISEVEYHTEEDGWQTFTDFEGPQTHNLLDLQRGDFELLGSFEMEAGTYTQIRFMLDAPDQGQGQPSTPGSYLEFEDGSTQALFVPSGGQTGYKAVGAFTVPSNGTVEVTADWDVRKAVVKAGASGMYILKPTIRLIVDNQAGQISGEVSNIPADTSIAVYAYESGTYEESEANDPAEEETRFPEAVNSDIADETGAYYLAYMAPGEYDLVIVANVEGEFTEVLGMVQDVLVESNQTTTEDIDIEQL
ncbi:MAG: DUF4382 domain-containing protein [bacterium]